MNYKITHTTNYHYTTPVSVCHNVVMLTPTTGPHLQVESHRLNIRPVPRIQGRRHDMFGNTVHRFSLEQVHSQLTITAISRVSVLPRELPPNGGSATCENVTGRILDRTDPNWLSVIPFLFDSPRIRRSSRYGRYAAQSVRNGAPIVAAAQALTNQIYSDFRYDKGATQVDTPTESAFEGRHGVCQDFAHVAVACLRSLSIPARYVSGYVRTHPPPGQPRLVGADESHAWVAVYCGADAGWVDFDPTNNSVCGTEYIPIAVGRDYGDVVPIKGVFLGGGEPSFNVSVDVAPG